MLNVSPLALESLSTTFDDVSPLDVVKLNLLINSPSVSVYPDVDCICVTRFVNEPFTPSRYAGIL